MKILTLISGVVGLILLIVKNAIEKDIEKKQKRAEAINEIKTAIDSRDVSAVNSAFQRMRND